MAYFDLILNTGKIFSPHYMREREKSYFRDQGSYPQEEQEVQLQSIVDRFSILKSVTTERVGEVASLTFLRVDENNRVGWEEYNFHRAL